MVKDVRSPNDPEAPHQVPPDRGGVSRAQAAVGEGGAVRLAWQQAPNSPEACGWLWLVRLSGVGRSQTLSIGGGPTQEEALVGEARLEGLVPQFPLALAQVMLLRSPAPRLGPSSLCTSKR